MSILIVKMIIRCLIHIVIMNQFDRTPHGEMIEFVAGVRGACVCQLDVI
jgi:hypothetical protein